MFSIKRDPDPVKIKTLGTDIAFCHLLLKYLFPIWKCPDITLPIGILQVFQFANNIVYPIQKAFVSGCLIHHSTGAEIMTKAVASNSFIFPAHIMFSFWFQPCLSKEF